MKKVFAWMAGVVAMGAVAGAFAAADVAVQLAAAKTDGGSGRLEVTIRNQGSEAVSLLPWQTPLDDSSIGAARPLFEVVDAQGRAAAYVGRLARRPAPRAEDYIVLGPGQSRSAVIDLSADYDLSAGGSYQVRYVQPSDAVLPATRGMAPASGAKTLQSNTVALWVDGGPRPLQQALQRLRGSIDMQAAAGGNSYVSCSNTQQSGIVTGRSQAVSLTSSATTYLNANKQGSRYTWWYGSYNASRYSTVKSNFGKLATALSNANYTFDCSCTQSNVYAYVYADQPYRVYLCGAFLNSPTSDVDARGGTLVHESSHFNVIAGTDDLAYGTTDSHSLAVSNPANAVRNADNYTYFSENANNGQ